MEEATAITPDGRFVVGYGRFNGQSRAFRADLAVVPEPGSLIALAAGTGFLICRRRR
ncbi:PEP-CTERM sorting domain-containing protein [bacterium]|nr:MAG: PEP-CTERM sorting domain-containing protein [bacterium]